MGLLGVNTAHHNIRLSFLLINCNNKRIGNHTSIITMILTFSRSRSIIIFKAIPSIKEFTYITTSVYLKDKSTTRVVIDEFSHIKDHLIKNHEFSASLNCNVKIIDSVIRCSFLNVIFVVALDKSSVPKFLDTHNNQD